MGNWRHELVTVTTDAAQAATVYTKKFTGRLINVIYTKDDYTNGVDFAITVEGTGIGVWTEADVNASTSRAPSQVVHDNTGTATALYDSIVLVNDRVKIAITSGGATKSGQFRVIYDKD